MSFLGILGLGDAPPPARPAFIADQQDIRGVRVVRLRGPVGKEIAREEAEAEAAEAEFEGVFSRSLLLDFRDTTACDFATVSYLIQQLRRRMAAHARVGIINAPRNLLSDLEISKVEGWFSIFSSEDEALRQLSADGAMPKSDSP